MNNIKKFLWLLVFTLLLVIIALFIQITDLNDEIKVKENEIDTLISDVNFYNELSNDYEYIIENSVVMRDNYNKKVNYMYGEATAYHPPSGGINSDSDPTRTSIGLKAEVGIIAVNPKVIPYGSQVMIISGKTVVRGIAGDTGGAMRKNPRQVDILVGSREKAMEWGRREVHIIWWEE